MNHLEEFSKLSTDTKEKILGFGITSKTVLEGFDRCTKLLTEFLFQKNVNFDSNSAFEWLDNFEFSSSNSKTFNHNTYLAFRRIIHLLLDNQKGELNTWKVYPSIKAKFPQTPLFINLISTYVDFLVKSNYAQATIDFRKRCAIPLLIFLEKNNISSLEAIDNKILSEYFISDRFSNRKPAGVHGEMLRAKLFLEYLVENDFVSNNLLPYAVPNYRVSETKIITTITPEAKTQILGDYSELGTNKREKAMYLLALHLGLRTNDIINLKFDDIEWESSILRIRQQKTKVSIRMMIDNETQNALIDYILNERRKTECPFIFIKNQGPTTQVGRHIGKTHKRINGIDVKVHIPHQGLHILRRTFASNLLKNGTPLTIISSALGHISKNEVHHYLSTDEERMKKCALGLDMIPFGRREF